MTKKEQRLEILERRDALSAEERETRSRAIREHLFSLRQWPGRGPVLFFHTMKTEVNTIPMMEEAISQEIPVALPRMAGPGRLTLHAVENLHNSLEPNDLGIMEPVETCSSVEATDLGIIIVPGVAFGPLGYRIGYGGGFYDRLLVSAPRALRVGVAFDLQRVESLLRKSHDVPVDILITESGPLTFHRRLVAVDFP